MRGRLGFDHMLLSACCKWHEVTVGLDMVNVSDDIKWHNLIMHNFCLQLNKIP